MTAICERCGPAYPAVSVTRAGAFCGDCADELRSDWIGERGTETESEVEDDA